MLKMLVKSVCIALFLALSTLSLRADIILELQDHWIQPNREHPGQFWEVHITSTVFDNFNGDFSRNEWRYTLTNINFDPDGSPWASGEGLTMFFPFLMYADFLFQSGPFRDFYEPEGWYRLIGPLNFAGDYPVYGPVAWLTSRNNALPIGSTAVFGFSMPKDFQVVSAVTLIGSPDLFGYAMRGRVAAPHIPEPSTVWLAAAGLAFAAALARTRGRRHSPDATRPCRTSSDRRDGTSTPAPPELCSPRR